MSLGANTQQPQKKTDYAVPGGRKWDIFDIIRFYESIGEKYLLRKAISIERTDFSFRWGSIAWDVQKGTQKTK